MTSLMDALYYHAVSRSIFVFVCPLKHIYVQPKDFEVRRVPIPEIGDEEVLFKGEPPALRLRSPALAKAQ